MFCPICKEIEMQEVTKQGVLIDVCSRCRGIWLDRGEMEKILAAGRTERRDYDEIYGDRENRHLGDTYTREAPRHNEHNHYQHKKHKKKSFFDMFEDIFD